MTQKGLLYERQQNVESAIGAYQEAMTEMAEPMNNLAWLYQTQGKFDEAMPLAHLAVQLCPNNANYIDTLAEILFKTGEHSEAVRVIEKAVGLSIPARKYREKLERFSRLRSDAMRCRVGTRCLTPALLIAALFPLTGNAQTEQFFDHSYAIVVGINHYPASRWRPLSYAINDATEVASFLRSQGFEVTALYEAQATKQRIQNEIHKLAQRLRERDRGLVFFAGHGYSETLAARAWGYIVPYDGEDNSVNYISMEELRTDADMMASARHQLFIIDACYAGLMGTRGAGIDPSTRDYLAEIVTAGRRSFDGRRHGPIGFGCWPRRTQLLYRSPP